MSTYSDVYKPHIEYYGYVSTKRQNTVFVFTNDKCFFYEFVANKCQNLIRKHFVPIFYVSPVLLTLHTEDDLFHLPFLCVCLSILLAKRHQMRFLLYFRRQPIFDLYTRKLWLLWFGLFFWKEIWLKILKVLTEKNENLTWSNIFIIIIHKFVCILKRKLQCLVQHINIKK